MDDEGLIPDELPEGDFAFLYTIPTFQNPSGRTIGSSAAPARRARRGARPARARGRSVRPRPLRGRGAAEPVRARGRRAIAYCSSFSKTVAPGCASAGTSCRRARGAARGPRGLDLHLAAVPLAGDGVRVPAAGQLRAEPRARERSAARAARRDARGARAEMPEDASWNRPEGGYFIWLDSVGPTSGGCSRRPRKSESHS